MRDIVDEKGPMTLDLFCQKVLTKEVSFMIAKNHCRNVKKAAELFSVTEDRRKYGRKRQAEGSTKNGR